MMENSVEKLVGMSQCIGSNPAYVQGGGGNISVKLDEEKMVIKSSGERLADMTLQQGYSVVDYRGIGRYLMEPDVEDERFTQAVKSYVMGTYSRPSIETGFHAVLGDVVIHTHSVYANILTCTEEGKGIVEGLFPESVWIDYFTPGRALTLKILEMAQRREKLTILFLKNHGLIVSGDHPDDCLSLHQEINAVIQQHFSLELADVDAMYFECDQAYLRDHVLFPDQVVYTLANQEILSTLAAKETVWSYGYIMAMIQRLRLTPCFLPPAECEFLLNMESEKYRQGLLGI